VSVIDIIILICCVPAIIHGISKGFVSQAFSLLGLILGAWLAYKFSNVAGEWLESFAELSPALLHVIAFALILLVVIVVVHLAGKIIEKLLKVVMLGWLDKLLGAVFSLLKAALIIGLVVVLFDALNSNIPLVSEEKIEESFFYLPIKELANQVFPYLKELIFKS